MKGGKRCLPDSDTPVQAAERGVKKQRLDDLQLLYNDMILKKKFAKEAEEAWRQARDSIGYIRSPMPSDDQGQ